MLQLTITVRAATEQDGPRIRSLLESCGLPTADLGTARAEFLVVCAGDTICGCGAVERFGQSGLLRSLAVTPDQRGLGIGRTLVQHLERRSREHSLGALVLLTQTARSFFEQQGYRVIERHNAPVAVRSSEEFRSLCPDSACCMTKNL